MDNLPDDFMTILRRSPRLLERKPPPPLQINMFLINSIQNYYDKYFEEDEIELNLTSNLQKRSKHLSELNYDSQITESLSKNSGYIPI